MDDQGVPQVAAAIEDGAGAVLYGMFTSFTEVLGNLEKRLDAIEAAVRAAPPVDAGLDARLGGIEELLRTGRAADAGAVEAASMAMERLGALEGAVRDLAGVARAQAEAPAPVVGPPGTALGEELSAALRAQGELLGQRTAALTAAVEALRQVVQTHADGTANSLGRRAGEAGRRLAGDLGLRGRPKPPPRSF